MSAPIVDVAPGIMTTVLPPLTPPVFLRLALPTEATVDRARHVYLRAANADLRTCTAGWREGAGVLVDCTPDEPDALAAEVHEIGRGLRALADATVARSYLELMDSRVEADQGSDATTQRGG